MTRLEGFCDLSSIDDARRLRVLSGVGVEDVWGVGRRLGPKLRALGINSAADLAVADFRMIHDTFYIVLAKTARELAGEQCLKWEESPTPKKEIMCSRSFGRPVLTIEDLAQALSVFVSRAAEKLRCEGSNTPSILVFIRTSYFRTDTQYAGATVVQLHRATDSTTELLAAVGKGDLFAAPAPANKLMDVMDALNERYGKATVAAASTLAEPDAPWQMRQERMTPAYTTDWNQVIDVWR